LKRGVTPLEYARKAFTRKMKISFEDKGEPDDSGGVVRPFERRRA